MPNGKNSRMLSVARSAKADPAMSSDEITIRRRESILERRRGGGDGLRLGSEGVFI
jgi:hypothetical protein